MLTTKNYKLKKIELADSPPDITVINPNWDVIDNEIKKVNDASGSYAKKDGSLQTELNAEKLNGKTAKNTPVTVEKTDLVGMINETFQYANDGKTQVANAITGKGVDASSSDTFSQLATKIGQISTGKKFASGTFKAAPRSTTFVALPFTPSFVLITSESTTLSSNWVLAREDFFHQYSTFIKDFGGSGSTWGNDIQKGNEGGISSDGFKFYLDLGLSTTMKYIAYE